MPTSDRLKPNTFAEDVKMGLSAVPKFLSSKYFYDDEGTRLFQEIMKQPEYYLTNAEFEVLETNKEAILGAFGTSFDIIELGAGDGTKTAVLLDHFLSRGADIMYSPVDISQKAIDVVAANCRRTFPTLSLKPKLGDYFQVLETLDNQNGKPKVLLFLGSTIGNFPREEALMFFRRLREVMSNKDLLFVGFDLQKDPHVILPAYDDDEGVTANFNLNLMRRINRELGGNFDVEKFSHYALYHPTDGAARSFVVSRVEQMVRVEALKQEFRFAPWEPIFMEISQKYRPEQIEDLAQATGFRVKRNFYDSRRYFVDSLWEVI